ncbi:MAG: ribosome maturation factor RimM [Acidimicrobiia bacterium]
MLRPAPQATKRASTLASSSSTDPGRFVIGRLGRPHGLDGFLGIYAAEEDMVGLKPGSTVFLQDRPHVVRAVRRVDRGFQVAFEGVGSRESAEEIRGLSVSVGERRTLADDEFWPEDLSGLRVFDEAGREVGVVRRVLFGPGQDRLEITTGVGASFEIPFVDELVPLVDLGAGRVVINSIPGLIEPG